MLAVITPIAVVTGAGAEPCPQCAWLSRSDGVSRWLRSSPANRARSTTSPRTAAIASDRLHALGVTPGAPSSCLQTSPGIVFLCDQTELAIERTVAEAILVKLAEEYMAPPLRLLFWETTKACNLSCRHCRAVPQRTLGPRELDDARAFDLIDAIAASGEAGVRHVGRRAAVPARSCSTGRIRGRDRVPDGAGH